MARIGTASEAASVLGMTLSSFNAIRLASTYIYDPITRNIRDFDRSRPDLRSFLASQHLIAPTLAGKRHPGRAWEFNLDLLEEFRLQGWPGAQPTPQK